MDPIVTVIDNFFDNPDEIRNYALNLEYRPPNNEGWLGYRCFTINENLSKTITEKIHKVIPESNHIDPFYYCFHYSLESTKETAPYNFDEYKIHPDFCDFAGIIYLYPNPPIQTGTSFFSEDKKLVYSIENRYNRLIYYSARTLHGPTDLFGTTKENSRLVITFFSDMPPSGHLLKF